jgi:hypothetical protein
VAWILTVLPAQRGWVPHESRADLLVPFRPCRGAWLWEVWTTPGGEVSAHPYARIDDLWLHFADPRTAGARAWAVSVEGEWQEEYRWLTRVEAERFRVRLDDPMVVRCDSVARTSSIEAAAWHQLGSND